MTQYAASAKHDDITGNSAVFFIGESYEEVETKAREYVQLMMNVWIQATVEEEGPITEEERAQIIKNVEPEWVIEIGEIFA